MVPLRDGRDGSEVRKQKRGFFKSIGSCFRSLPTEDVYPLTVYHVAAKITRRHTIYTKSATERNRWYNELTKAVEVCQAKQPGIEVPFFSLFYLFTRRITNKCSYTILKRLRTVSSVSPLHVSGLPAGSNSPVVPFVLLNFVGCFAFISLVNAHATFSVSRGALPRGRLYQWDIR